MKKLEFIFELDDHKWAIIARDPEKQSYLIDTNEYLVIADEQALLTDPGGIEIFPSVFSAICSHFNPEQIVALFASHQDPDIISSLSLWLGFNPKIRCYTSWLWSEFITHFGGNKETFINIPDEGMSFQLGRTKLQAIAAHYLHSSGNFHLYDAKAKILFSGDVGAALLPKDHEGLYVEDFSRHIGYAETFHRRWMGSNRAKLNWCERVSKLDIDMLCPQHGDIYRGADVERFINWFSELNVGSGVV